MAEMGNSLKQILLILIGAIVLTSILSGMRTSALTNAYDNTKAFNVTDSAGTVHTVAASGISGDTVALLYALTIGLVWIIAVVAMVLLLIKGLKG